MNPRLLFFCLRFFLDAREVAVGCKDNFRQATAAEMCSASAKVLNSGANTGLVASLTGLEPTLHAKAVFCGIFWLPAQFSYGFASLPRKAMT